MGGCRSPPRWVMGSVLEVFGDRGKALVSNSPGVVFERARLPLFVIVSWETDIRSNLVH
ncbi:hypothetical protein TIFTF001_021883 [Ficus carica]|uniref:Uncharacterized protein n=1 Tax=Ficus carica TaxID=3494 RepID=A0AA88DCA7_FICCA|nr:hypothetical protein TIFTF001_021883 [Ficus carica]